MPLAPGYLSDLGDLGSRGWNRYTASVAQQALDRYRPDHIAAGNDADLKATVGEIEWPAHPVRVALALNVSANEVDAFLDWVTADGRPFGRIVGQEEYLEWRVVRRPSDGKITRIEMTCETPDYWRILGTYEPVKVIEIIARFIGVTTDQIDPRLIWGFNPMGLNLGSGAVQARMRNGYISMMEEGEDGSPPKSPYNNGQLGICHMAKGVNSYNAAVSLVVSSAKPWIQEVDGARTPLTGNEAISTLGNEAPNAQRCRNSDPTIASAVIDLAAQGSKIALPDPFGIYITSLPSNLKTPGNKAIPKSWFALQRGVIASANPLGKNTFQRVVLEVPVGLGFVLGDLLDGAGKPIVSAGQVVRGVSVGVHYKSSDPGKVAEPQIVVPDVADPGCDADQPDGEQLRKAYAAFKASTQAAAEAAPADRTLAGRAVVP